MDLYGFLLSILLGLYIGFSRLNQLRLLGMCFTQVITTAAAYQGRAGPLDQVECLGFRPGTLLHHRTCGFPHPAVEPAAC